MKSLAYNGRYLMMGFASNKLVADEKFVVPRRVMLGNFKLCGVLLNYAADPMVHAIKQAMGWNVAPRELGVRISEEIVELVRSGAVRAVVGQTVEFAHLPAAMDAMAHRATTGRTIVVV
jgi:NADPH:quinone reductase-like Zn-dependent oxidoreductase